MTGELFEIFMPTAKCWREQKELEKVLIIDAENGGNGPGPLDLDSGVVELIVRSSAWETARQISDSMKRHSAIS